jgi:DNA modification methylase
MCENVNDRPTNDYEFLYLLTKSSKYYFDNEAIREPYVKPLNRWGGDILRAQNESRWDKETKQKTYRNRNMRPNKQGRNCRTVWKINTKSSFGNHVAKFPEELCIKPILAGCPKNGIVLDPFFGAGTTGVVAKKLGRNYLGIELNPEYCIMAQRRIDNTMGSLL